MARLRTTFLAAIAASALVLTGCTSDGETSSNDSAANSTAAAQGDTDTITIEDNDGEQVVPVDPETVVSLDNRTFEVLADWGVELAAAPLDLIPNTIDAYSEDSGTLNIGNHREPDLELIAAVDPDLVIQGQRFTNYKEDLEQLAPNAAIVDFEVRDGEPLDQELARQVEGLGQIFGKEAEADQLVEDFNEALERARQAYDPEKTVMAVNVSGGEIGYIAPSIGRTYGFLFDLVGMTPALEVEGSSSNHEGDDISVEAIAQSNPDLLLVLDRDAGTAAGREAGFKGAEGVIGDNAALQNVTAVQDDAIYIAPADTYTNESIITYTEILNGMADLFESAQ